MHEFPTTGPVTLDLRLSSGMCEIRAEPRETATVSVEPYDGSDAARDAARDTRVEMSGDSLLVTAPEAGGWLFRRSPRLRITVAVPSASSGRVRVASADLSAYGEWSDMKVNTASGDVHVEHITGDLAVNTASGDVRAGRIGGNLSVNTASGDVAAKQVGGSADIKGASADVDIDDLGGSLRSNSASGDVTVGAARRGTITVRSASGDVSIGVTAGTSVWLDLNTLSGRTSSDLNMGGGGGGEGAGEGTPGQPDLTVQVSTLSGDIAVHRVHQPAG